MKAIIYGKAKWKPSESPIQEKIVSQKHYYISRGIVQNNDTTNGLKDAEGEVPTTSSFHSPIRYVQKTEGL